MFPYLPFLNPLKNVGQRSKVALIGFLYMRILLLCLILRKLVKQLLLIIAWAALDILRDIRIDALTRRLVLNNNEKGYSFYFTFVS